MWQVSELLLQHQESLKLLDSASTAEKSGSAFRLNEATVETLLLLKQKLKEEFEKAGDEWEGMEEKIWSFGPRRCGPNILLNCVESYSRPTVWDVLESKKSDAKIVEFDNSIVNGFQIATLSGPLCEEQMYGVCFVVEDWWFGDRNKQKALKLLIDQVENGDNVNGETSTSEQCVMNNAPILGMDSISRQSSVFGPLTGQLISSMKEGCRRAFQVNVK